MMFMNEWDVDWAKRRFSHLDTPNLQRGAEVLSALVDWANENSDGWAYWPKPGRAAASLMKLLTEADGFGPDVSEAQLVAAFRPVKAFLTRQGVAHSEVFVEHKPEPVVTHEVTVDGVEGTEGQLFTMEVEGQESDVLMSRRQAEYLFEKLGFVLGKEGF